MLVLASGSPRRAALLRAAGVSFRVIVPSVDESLLPGEPGDRAAERLARAKALAVDGGGHPVLAADTLVLCDGHILGKPGNDEEARAMLAMLANREHEVVTGVCMVAGGDRRSALERTLVRFAALTPAQIATYVASGEPRDRAGAYHIDGRCSFFIEGVTGSSSNVAGLPMRAVHRLAVELGVTAALESTGTSRPSPVAF
jgi:septum formation protein